MAERIHARFLPPFRFRYARHHKELVCRSSPYFSTAKESDASPLEKASPTRLGIKRPRNRAATRFPARSAMAPPSEVEERERKMVEKKMQEERQRTLRPGREAQDETATCGTVCRPATNRLRACRQALSSCRVLAALPIDKCTAPEGFITRVFSAILRGCESGTYVQRRNNIARVVVENDRKTAQKSDYRQVPAISPPSVVNDGKF